MRKLFFILAVPALLAGCQEEIELDLEDPEEELVIEGYLAGLDFYIPDNDLVCGPDEVIPRDSLLFYAAFAKSFDIDSIDREADYFPYNKVRLTTTAPYFDNEPAPVVTGAKVELYQDGNLVETLGESTEHPGTYPINFEPVPGREYHLKVEAEVAGQLQRYETIPEIYRPTPPILTTEAIFNPEPPFGDSAGYFLGISTYEVPGAGDHYRWAFYINNEYQSDPFDISVANDDGIDGSCVPAFDVYGTRLTPGDSMAVFQSRISQKHFDFLVNLRQQTAFVGGPFDTPPAPIIGNVKNVTKGTFAFGYFVPAAVSVGFVVVPDELPAN